MKKLFTVLTVMSVTTVLSLSVFAGDALTGTEQVINSSIMTDLNSDLSLSALEPQDDMVTKQEIKSFKGKFTDQLLTLNNLRTDCQNLWTSIKSNNQNIKSEWSALKASLKEKDKSEARKIIESLKASLVPLRTQVKALHSDMKDLKALKKTEWEAFRSAVKAMDESKASTALNNIINLKKQIIEKQKSILETKQKISELIKS